jgi:hypothetical protein
MIRIAITAEAYEAVARTLAFGTVAVEPHLNERGERLIWLEERQLDKLNSIRRSGEGYSEAIIRLAVLWEGHWTHGRRLSKLRRGKGGSYSDVIIRLAKAEAT